VSSCEHQWYPVAGNRLCCVKCDETCSPVDEAFPDTMTCCGCGERFPHAELQTLGGGGPFCEPCAERIEAEMGGL
jgi:hypothetical protein